MAWLLIYPDAYEIGLPNQGLQILYEILNERDDAVAERSYAPWIDMEAEMRRRRVPAVLGRRPPAGGRLRPAGLQPVGRAGLHQRPQLHRPGRGAGPLGRARRARIPLVVAGGHCTFNPEPLADFVDLFVIGDGEEVGLRDHRGRPGSGRRLAGRTRRLPPAACCGSWPQVPGVYVPSMYDVAYDGERLVAVTPRYPDVPERVEKRTIADLAAWPYPKHQLVPMTEVVHDRLNVEIFRGCTRGCRFCQAGMITRPVRERPAAQVRQMVSRRACGAPATTRSASRRCRAPTTRASTRRSRASSTTRCAPGRCR